MIERIYLGDRTLKGIELQGHKKEVRIQIDWISRIRPECVEWDFYNDEDVENGYLVFSGVSFFQILPEGSLPSDYIIDFSLNKNNNEVFESEFSVGGFYPDSPDAGGLNELGECYIRIKHKDSWIENNLKERIFDIEQR